MKTESLQSAIETNEAKAYHVKALIDALGNPSEWEHNGQVNDCGPDSRSKCACGHPIRYEFVICHPARGQSHVGSTCIEHLQSISPALGAALEASRLKLEQELALAKAAAKNARDTEDVEKLWNEYATLRDEVIAVFRNDQSRGLRSPWIVWHFSQSYRERFRRQTPPEYTRACDLKKWLTKAIAYVQGITTQIHA